MGKNIKFSNNINELEFFDWVDKKTMTDVWNLSNRGDWMMWLMRIGSVDLNIVTKCKIAVLKGLCNSYISSDFCNNCLNLCSSELSKNNLNYKSLFSICENLKQLSNTTVKEYEFMAVYEAINPTSYCSSIYATAHFRALIDYIKHNESVIIYDKNKQNSFKLSANIIRQVVPNIKDYYK